ncbi:MAG: hypothetical protein H0X01_10360 [Nitrospira sp.]|nr:hypothetical protein [Nitrospira sp.]
MFGDFSRYATILPAEHQPALKRDLTRIPDFSWLLSDPHPSLNRLQGDLIKDFPTVFLDDSATPWSRNFTVMLLNNTCDLPDDRLDFVTAAPVIDFQKYLDFERPRRTAESLRAYADSIRRNDKTELFYLPKFDEFQNGGLVLLHRVCSVSAQVYRQALTAQKRVASFTQTGFYFLLMKMTTHIARAETAEVVRG